MANNLTDYLQMPYNDPEDAAFRAQYVLAMDVVDKEVVQNFILDGRIKDTFNMRYPASRENAAIFDDGFVTPTKDFEIIPKQTRYVRIGDKVFYEVQFKSKIAIVVNSNGDIANIAMGTLNKAFVRRFGEVCYAINHIAANYVISSGKFYLASFGGMSLGTTIPKGTSFAVAGWFTT